MRELGSQIGRYQSDSIPLWVEWMMHLPGLKKKFAKRAVSEIRVFEQGIMLMHGNHTQKEDKAMTLSYKEIRRIWFERFQTGSEQAGHTAFRIDIIAENLDTLFSLTQTDCAENDSDLRLMEYLYQTWKASTWKHYHVVAAIIQMEAGKAGRTDIQDPETPVYLCMQKPRTRYDYTSYHWEFPGGKVEEGESETQALQRELKEEMEYEVAVGLHLTTIEHSYRDFSLSLSCYLCKATTPNFVRKEHQDHRWLTAEEMQSLEWCAADFPVIEMLCKQ